MILRHSDEIRAQVNEKMRDGKGSVTVRYLLEPEEMFGKGRLFAENLVPVGASIGLHQHKGDSEAYYFLQGTGRYLNNSDEFAVKAGDVTVVAEGDWHSIENTGTQPMVFIALILFTEPKA